MLLLTDNAKKSKLILVAVAKDKEDGTKLFKVLLAAAKDGYNSGERRVLPLAACKSLLECQCF